MFDVIEKDAGGRCQLEGEISRKIWRTRTNMQLNLTKGGKGLLAIVIRLFGNWDNYFWLKNVSSIKMWEIRICIMCTVKREMIDNLSVTVVSQRK